ncbi:MAG: GAF domain-containing protein [Candidatus Aminicenantes bacterium]|nr:GAF domain-containing protein [Candidatus Aminicenantes bacterium]
MSVDYELKKRAEKLEQEKEYTRSLLKGKMDGYIAVDEYGEITEVNESAWKLLGYNKEEIYKKNVKEIYASDEASRIMKKLRKSPDGSIDNIETRLQSKGNEDVPILLSASFLWDRGLNLKEALKKGDRFPNIGYFRYIRAEEIFHNISSRITSIANEKELLDKTAKIVVETIKAESCSIFIYNESSGLLEVISSFGIPQKIKGERGIETYAENDGMTGAVFGSGKTLNISNLDLKYKIPKRPHIKWNYVRKIAKHSRYGELKHFLGTPLHIQGEVYGVIRVLNKYSSDRDLDKGGFPVRDKWKLEDISTQVSKLLEGVRNRERFEAISRVGMELNEKIDLPLAQLLNTIVEQVVTGMRYKACSLRLLEENDKLTIKACCGINKKYIDNKNYTLRIGEGIPGKVALTGKRKIFENLGKVKESLLKQFSENEELKSMLSIPLKYRDRVIGVINCYSRRIHKFMDQEIQTLEIFASYASVAIRNKKRMDELLKLNEVGGELIKPFELTKLYDLILQRARSISGADRVCLKKYDERTGKITTLKSLNCEWHKKIKDYDQKLGENFISEAIKERQPKIIQSYDISQEKLDRVPYKELFKDTKSCIIVPIKIHNRVFNVLCFESKKNNFFSEDDLLILKSFSTQASIALRNANFIKKLQDVGETFKKISELDVDIDVLLKKIVEIAAKVLETDILILFRYNKKQDKIIWPPIYTGDKINFPDLLISEEISSDTPLFFIRGDNSHYSANAQIDVILTKRTKKDGKHYPERFVIREQIVSSAGILLKVGQEKIGIMFINYRTAHEFDSDERQIIEILASYIAIAIQNVIHFNEKQTANTMQTIGRVASNFAHKIKNDLGSINLYTGDLIDQVKPGMPQYLPVTHIKEKILKITEDVNSLLNTTKLNVNIKKIVDVKRIIDDLKSEISSDLKNKKIAFDIEISPNLPEINIDATQIKMALLNLAQNSMDAMPRGGKISLSITKVNNNLLFKWTDSGAGISPNDSYKIFDIFWTTKGKGFGLGLFHANAIIEEHGGSISLDSNYKKGSRFLIMLPLK